MVQGAPVPIASDDGRPRARGHVLALAAGAAGLALLLAMAVRPGTAGADVVIGAIVVVGVMATQVGVLAPSLGRRTTRALRVATGSAVRATIGALTTVSVTLAFGLVVLPAWLISSPVRHRRRRAMLHADGEGWIAREPAGTVHFRHPHCGRRPSTTRSARAVEPGGSIGPGVPVERAAGLGPPHPQAPTPSTSIDVSRSRTRTVLTVAGFLLVAMVLDVAAGAALSGTGLLRPSDRGDLLVVKRESARAVMGMPNIGGEPWARPFADELADFQLQDPTYVPYLISAPHDYEGTYLNVAGGERRSYRPDRAAGAPALQVAFFGGSTMFGIGQRDQHTIPSEIARIAESHGVALDVHNYGFPAWVAWQEYLYLERLLAAGHRFDLIVFYDGFNEFLVQRTDYSEQPTHYGASALQALASDFHDEHETEPGYLSGVAELTESYRRNSALWRVAEQVLGAEEPPSWRAAPSSAGPTAQQEAALAIYGRAHRTVTELARRNDTPVRSFWQPIQAGWPPDVHDALPDDVIGLSHALDGHQADVYIGEVHTNELGAHLVSEAMWAELEPTLRSLAAAADDDEAGHTR